MLPRFRLPRCIGAREVAALALLALPIAMVNPAAAQPSPEQIDTIRQACRSDYIAHCSGVQPGGREALQCLEHNAAQLSQECGSAVSAVAPKPEDKAAETRPETTPETPPPAAAAAPPSALDQLAAVQQACTLKDFMSHCSWIAPGNPELVLCLRANAGELSPACQNVLRATPATATPAAAAAVTPALTPAPAAPRAATAPNKPSPKQISAIRAACRSDFISYCSGVQPGGRDALICLERNKAGASRACQSALAAIGGGAASPDATAPVATAPADATPQTTTDQFRIRRTLREELAILRVCAADHRSLCDGIPLGGGRIIACLARNASRLGPECRAALGGPRG